MTAPTKPIVIDAPGAIDDQHSDPSDLAHYVDQRIDQDVTTALIEGTELVALCGYRWVPSRDPRRLAVCQPCVLELDRILRDRA